MKIVLTIAAFLALAAFLANARSREAATSERRWRDVGRPILESQSSVPDNVPARSAEGELTFEFAALVLDLAEAAADYVDTYGPLAEDVAGDVAVAALPYSVSIAKDLCAEQALRWLGLKSIDRIGNASIDAASARRLPWLRASGYALRVSTGAVRSTKKV